MIEDICLISVDDEILLRCQMLRAYFGDCGDICL